MKPITFSTPMAKARQEGRKKQTRRVIKFPNQTKVLAEPPHHVCQDGGGNWIAWYGRGGGTNEQWAAQTLNLYPNGEGFPCPYGKVGDKLYTREEHYLYGNWQKDGLTKTGKQKWKFVPDGDTVLYSNDNPIHFKISMDKENPEKKQWYKRLARFMPKKYARDFPVITGIRAERLLDISEEDSVLEGVELYNNYDGTYGGADAPMTYRDAFLRIIQMLHGPEIIENNPFVWVLEIK